MAWISPRICQVWQIKRVNDDFRRELSVFDIANRRLGMAEYRVVSWHLRLAVDVTWVPEALRSHLKTIDRVLNAGRDVISRSEWGVYRTQYELDYSLTYAFGDSLAAGSLSFNSLTRHCV